MYNYPVLTQLKTFFGDSHLERRQKRDRKHKINLKRRLQSSHLRWYEERHFADAVRRSFFCSPHLSHYRDCKSRILFGRVSRFIVSHKEPLHSSELYQLVRDVCISYPFFFLSLEGNDRCV